MEPDGVTVAVTDGDPANDPDVAASFRAEWRAGTRDTTLIAGLFALIGSPLWIIFDAILVPDRATEFIVVRMIMEVAVAACLGALYWRRFGDRWPEQLSLAAFALLELGVCWMIPRTGDHLGAYLLGLSLAIYGTSFLVIWRWQMALVLLGIIGAGIALFSIGADPGLNGSQIATCAFYLVTAGALSLTALVYRERKLWEQYVTKKALEIQRHRNEELMRELDRQSREDALTAVGNRRAWEERVSSAWDAAHAGDGALAIVLCDLDNFKQVNDELGHVAGDAVLSGVATILSGCVRHTDFLARLGGDEFAILCPDTSAPEAAVLASKVSDRIRAASFPHGIQMTVSIGVADRRADVDGAADLYHRADGALYAAKVDRDTFRCATRPEPLVTIG